MHDMSNLWHRGLVHAADPRTLYRGEAGVPGNMVSLQSAAEELTFFFQEKVEHSLKEYDVREYIPPRLFKVEKLQELMALLGGQDATDLDNMAERLLALAASGRDVLADLSLSSNNASLTYIALTYALAKASDHDPQVGESIKDAIEETLQARRTEIFADLNTVNQAAAYGDTNSDAANFRATYKDAVLGQASFSRTLLLVIERFGERIENGITLLKQALAADMASEYPSMDPVRLHAILRDLHYLSSAAAVLKRCELLVERMGRNFGLPTLEALPLMMDLAKWLGEPWLMAFHVSTLLQRHGFDLEEENESEQVSRRHHDEQGERRDGDGDHEEQAEWPWEYDTPKASVTFLNEILSILRSMPEQAFLSPEHRFQAIAAVLQVMDGWLLEKTE